MRFLLLFLDMISSCLCEHRSKGRGLHKQPAGRVAGALLGLCHPAVCLGELPRLSQKRVSAAAPCNCPIAWHRRRARGEYNSHHQSRAFSRPRKAAPSNRGHVLGDATARLATDYIHVKKPSCSPIYRRSKHECIRNVPLQVIKICLS